MLINELLLGNRKSSSDAQGKDKWDSGWSHQGSPIPPSVTPRVGVCAHTPGACPRGSGRSPGRGVGEPLLSWTLCSPGGHGPVRARHPLQESAEELSVNGVLRDKRTVGSGGCREGSWLAGPGGDFEADT